MNSDLADDIAVFQTGEGTTDVLQSLNIHVGTHQTRSIGQLVHDLTPGINNHAVTVGLATVHVIAALPRGQHITQVL